MLNLILLLIVSLTALAVGLARQEEQLVKVPLKSSARLKGATYHPNSQGVEMPESHAKALGFNKSDYLGEEPEGEEDSSESKSDGKSEEEVTGASETEDESKGEEPEEPKEDTSKEESEPESDDTLLPEDTSELDKLIADERFSTVESLLANKEELTDIKGIGPATAEEIIEHVIEAQKG